jgi:uncharacterized membrane protein
MWEPTDSATYMQVAWSVFHGTPFTTSIQESFISYSPYNFLGDQLIFTLSLFSPLLFFTTSGLLFIFLQTAIISFGALFLYQYANLKLENRWVPLLIVSCFLFNPATYLSFQCFGFRVETLFIPFIFAVFFFVESKKFLFATLFVILTLLTKHNAIPIVFTLGFYYLLMNRVNWRFGLVCILLSLVYYLVGVELIMAHFQQNPTAHFKHFAQFGNSPLQAFGNLILNPSEIISMISGQEISHMLSIMFPAGMLAIINPIFWISAFQLLIISVLSDYHSIFCGWHWSLVVPFVFLGMTSTIRWIIDKAPKGKVTTYSIVILLSIDLLFHVSLFDQQIINSKSPLYVKSNDIDVKQISDSLAMIEDNASVMVSAKLLWHLYDRERVYTSSVKFHDDVDYIAMLSPLESPLYRNIDKNLIIEFKKQGQKRGSKFDGFALIYQDENLLIYKKNHNRTNSADTKTTRLISSIQR